VKRVLLTDTIAPAGEEALRREVDVVRAPDSDVATLRTWARDVDGVLTRSKLPDDLFEAAPRVRGVVVHGTGTDLVPVAAATAHGVMVANLPVGTGPGGLPLGITLAARIGHEARVVSAGRWSAAKLGLPLFG
jgi:phosphoglycerate dehydrogenase-like enzyme